MNCARARKVPGAGQSPIVALTFADQVVSSASNFAVGVVIARAGGAHALGSFGIAFLVWLVAVGFNRALINEPMTVADVQGAAALRVSPGAAATALLGCGWVVLLVIGWAGARLAGSEIPILLALAPWMPFLLLQEYARSVAFRLHRPGCALKSDLVFAVVQGAMMAVLLGLGVRQAAWYLACWGAGSVAGALVARTALDGRPTLRQGVDQLRSTWHASRWFLAEFGTAFVSDQGYMLLLPVLLGTAEFGQYRAAMGLVGPVVMLFLAAGNVGLPQFVRRLREHGTAGLRHYTPRFSAAMLVVSAAYCGALALLAEPLLRVVYGVAFTDAATVTRLLAGQYAVYSVALGAGIALRAAGRLRSLWQLRLFTASVSVTATVVLGRAFGTTGVGAAAVLAATALAAGTIVVFRRELPAGKPGSGTTAHVGPPPPPDGRQPSADCPLST